MSIDSAIARFRRRREQLHRDEASVMRPPATPGTLDPVTGEWTPAAPTRVYCGACTVRAFAWEGTDVFVGGTEVRLRRVRATFPADTDIQHNDMIIPSASTYDESLVGVSFRVSDVFRDGWQIARVAIAEEVSE